jgi:dynein heavy chain
VLKQLLPMPSKSHYTFNLRDISKIFLGLCSAYIKTTNEDIDLIRLWVHENKRVFGDRLISNEDRELLENLLMTEIKNTFGYEKDKIYFIERLMYSDFLQGIDQDVRYYMPVTDLKEFQKLLERLLEDYNSMGSSKRQMKIIMFLDACEHVTRICRILRQPQGHALLLGVGGSGRQSLSKLSIYLANHKQFSIEVTKTYGLKNWREDLKKCVLKPAGIEEKRISFLFVDTQIIGESMLEDINNIINSGDVPGIYAKDDKEEIELVGQAECQKRKMALTQMNKWSMYYNRVKKNIHIILAMSPLSEEFRNRLRQFPSLVSCCTIDWFTEWPAEALVGVARGNLMEKNIDLGSSLDAVVEMFKYIHQSVEIKSQKYLQIMRRHNYVTPTSYLEFMTLYGDILKKKRKENEQKQQRLKKGIDVLNDAKVKIEILQDTLNKQRPILEKTKQEIKVTKEEITQKTEEAKSKKEIVAQAQETASQQEADVSVLQAEAQKKLAEAEPILQQAITVLKKLQVNDFYFIKNLPHPPPAVIKVAEMMCVMFDIPPKPDKKTPEDPYGYFAAMKLSDKLLSNPNKMKDYIFNYDKDHIKEFIVKRTVGLLNNPDITLEKVESVSVALKGLYMWIDAMMKYHENLKLVMPLRLKVAEIQARLDKVRAELAAYKRELDEIDKRLANLEDDKRRKEKEEADLIANINKCEKRLENSKKLLSGLENEAVRWGSTIETLKDEYQCLIANSLNSAAVVAYAGVFTAEYRRDLESEWINKLDELELKRSEDLTMVKILKDDVRIREWNVAGLPSDSLSVENAIIAFEARRWPLMIDPQTQANKFIKKFGSRDEGGLLIFKASEGSIAKQLETAIELGQWVLLENIGEKLDPALEPLLQLQRIRKGEPRQIQFGDKSLTYSEGFDFFLHHLSFGLYILWIEGGMKQNIR